MNLPSVVVSPPSRSGWLIIGLIIVLALPLSACFVSSPGLSASTQVSEPSSREKPVASSPEAVFSDRQAMQEEYENATEQLPSLPPDSTYPAAPPGDWEPDARYESGVGELAAALHWQCVWLQEYVQAADRGDPVATAAALEHLDKWADLPMVKTYIDPESRSVWPDRVIGPARVGNDGLLREVAAGCARDLG